MAKDFTPKAKRCRRLGVKPESNLEGSSSVTKAVAKRSYPPGIHGPKGHPRMTDYGLHLREKQKLSFMYGLLERQLAKYFKEAVKQKQNTATKLIEILERRLDNVVFRLGLAVSRAQARQMVNHGLFKINDKKIKTPSYLVKTGDVLTIKKEKSAAKGLLAENLKKMAKQETPGWLIWDDTKKQAQVSNLPQAKDLEVGIDVRLIVEYYSK